jgi:hypothetical protein
VGETETVGNGVVIVIVVDAEAIGVATVLAMRMTVGGVGAVAGGL